MKVKVYVATNRIGSKVEEVIDVPDEDLDGLTDAERAQLVNEYAQAEVFDSGMFEWGWEPVAESDRG